MTLRCSRTDGSRFNGLRFLLSWIAGNDIGSRRTRRTGRLLWGGAEEDMDATSAVVVLIMRISCIPVGKVLAG